ncbi:GNAT family N-acetyltransferase [Listeria sp. FSL L7-0091]|uniref:GNAT family N-acetyltransferase n=1 Tax=Listeria farberi TaxID=2713500 RepID=A0A7X0ZHI3_9LIST|nr:GNAT family N-acetyltransferase [Listeria farberi]MBC1375398.1 GNAT family N-acetyltransferase [Listeria farberi]MBC1381613.1 GNAT family N-acetyltransferase [Listeria farberi]MBC2260111.1 GNAT family N-acetyltransferase [Listeria farberi]MBC2287415.1 GNAT family N-acetyltransferase [Listeria farberi]
MNNIETNRLILINYTLEMIQATINGTEALEKASGYQVSPDWPGIDFFFYLPYVLENVKKDKRMIKWTRLVVLKKENKIIGEIGGQGNPNETGEIEIGYSIAPDYQNKGYMSEALIGMIAWLEEQHEIKRIFARCYEQNEASIQVLKHNHFVHIVEKDTEERQGRVMMWEYPIKQT